MDIADTPDAEQGKSRMVINFHLSNALFECCCVDDLLNLTRCCAASIESFKGSSKLCQDFSVNELADQKVSVLDLI